MHTECVHTLLCLVCVVHLVHFSTSTAHKLCRVHTHWLTYCHFTGELLPLCSILSTSYSASAAILRFDRALSPHWPQPPPPPPHTLAMRHWGELAIFIRCTQYSVLTHQKEREEGRKNEGPSLMKQCKSVQCTALTTVQYRTTVSVLHFTSLHFSSNRHLSGYTNEMTCCWWWWRALSRSADRFTCSTHTHTHIILPVRSAGSAGKGCWKCWCQCYYGTTERQS